MKIVKEDGRQEIKVVKLVTSEQYVRNVILIISEVMVIMVKLITYVPYVILIRKFI